MNDIRPKQKPARGLTMQTDKHRQLHIVPGLGLTMDVRNWNEHCFVSMITTESSLFLIHEGSMLVESPGLLLTAGRGEFIMLQAGMPVKITHETSEHGLHAATGLFWDRKIIAEASQSLDACLKEATALLGAFEQNFHASFAAAYRALQNAEALPKAIVAHRLQEVLLWLAQDGLFFRPAENQTLTARLREMLTANPGAAWPEKTVAKALGQSPATLRRHLASEATTFRDVLAETRMLHALRLLHSTDQPIGVITESCGYKCPSRFAEAFRQRFGFHPSAVRGHRRGSKSNFFSAANAD